MTSPPPSLFGLSRSGADYLQTRKVPSAHFDAQVLLAHALGTERADLLGRMREEVPLEVEKTYRSLLEARGRRVPLQQILGRQEFWSLDFLVNERVLIPRPETEVLVEETLSHSMRANPLIADVGTGSGNIAVAVAWELPTARVLATDISGEALEVAQRNAVRHGVQERIRFLKGDLDGPLAEATGPGSLDFLLSNPPYVAERELATLEPEVRDYEPRLALTVGPEPAPIYERLLSAGVYFLRPGGRLILELPAGGAEWAVALVRREPALQFLDLRSDYSGIPRVLVSRRK
jgi:release factor glutamine methyltransferase